MFCNSVQRGLTSRLALDQSVALADAHLYPLDVTVFNRLEHRVIAAISSQHDRQQRKLHLCHASLMAGRGVSAPVVPGLLVPQPAPGIFPSAASVLPHARLRET